jgi:hypothetical protein
MQAPPTDIPNDAVLDTATLAKWTGYNKRYVCELINKGKIPGLRLSAHRLGVRAGAYREWLKSLEIKAADVPEKA